MKKFSYSTIIIVIALLTIACSELATQNKVQNPFAENGIQSYEVIEMEIHPSGIEAGGLVFKQAEFDKDGKLLKEILTDISYTSAYIYKDSLLVETIMTNGDGLVISTEKMEYKGNQVTELNFGENNEPGRIRTLYKDKEGRDTLIVYTTADNDFLYRLSNRYDAIGLKESIMYTDDDTTYTIRKSDNKLKQIFESMKPDGTLIYKETKTYDDKGREVEFLYDGFGTPGVKDISHHKTIYQDNGLIESILYYDSEGNPVKREVYEYKKFDK